MLKGQDGVITSSGFDTLCINCSRKSILYSLLENKDNTKGNPHNHVPSSVKVSNNNNNTVNSSMTSVNNDSSMGGNSGNNQLLPSIHDLLRKDPFGTKNSRN